MRARVDQAGKRSSKSETPSYADRLRALVRLRLKASLLVLPARPIATISQTISRSTLKGRSSIEDRRSRHPDPRYHPPWEAITPCTRGDTPVTIDVCEGCVTLGNTVCEFCVRTPSAISSRRFGSASVSSARW